jgi:integrase
VYKNERIVTFTGPFADICHAYLQKNRALGYKYNINETYLKQFDSFCIGKAQPGDPITKELFEEWTQKRDYEAAASHGIRYKVLAQFCTDLNNNGAQTYIGFHSIKHDELGRGFAPYIFTADEISRFLAASAEVKPSKWSRCTHLVLPVMFRLLYSSGLRLSEAIMLEIPDVDLDAGMLSIRDTKFDKSRKLPMAESMLAVCKWYVQKMQEAFRGTRFFFPAPDGGHFAECTIYTRYREILFAAGISHGGRGKGPRLHDLRHTFAVHALRKLVSEGQDLYVTLPILSNYLGHKSLVSTECYLRLTAEVYPELTENFEAHFGPVFPEVQS